MSKSKHLILILEYDMGDYSNMEKNGHTIPTDPKDIGFNESFYQSDAEINKMKIVGARIEDNDLFECSKCGKLIEYEDIRVKHSVSNICW